MNRRHFLRSAGVTLGLPFFESLAKAAPAATPRRYAFIYTPNGYLQTKLLPEHLLTKNQEPATKNQELILTPTLQPLADVKDDITFVTGLDRQFVPGTGVHAQAGSCWLTSSAPQETLDGGFPTNTTLDQLIVRQIGSECALPSLELSTNDFADNKETRYFESISWYAPGYAANTEKNPRAVFQRLFGQGRGGPTQSVLGMAAIHFMGGNGERTSPVERGAWVLRKLLHDTPPPAPANVPAITLLAGKVLTTHERLLAHQEDPQCASCHRKIDPIGFGLENFNAAGQWRTEDSYTALDANGKPDPKSKKTWTIDSAAAFHKGPAFKDYFELRNIIASKSDTFARSFSEALIEFALGRPIGFRDEPLVDEILKQARKKDFAMREFIHALTASNEFHTK